MSNLVRGQGGWSATRLPTADNEWDSSADGRHALNEDAELTPIFHAMTRGAWRTRQHEQLHAAARQVHADPVDEFHRDPLTAPIPVQAPTASAIPIRRSGAHALADTHGRHHRRRDRVSQLPRR